MAATVDLFWKNYAPRVAGVKARPVMARVKAEADFVELIVQAKSVMETEKGEFLTSKAMETITDWVKRDTNGVVTKLHGSRIFRNPDTGNIHATVYLWEQGKSSHEGEV